MDRYPLVSSLSRPLIARHLVGAARAHGADAVHDEITGLVVNNGRFKAVRLASGARIDAGAFVLAVGPLLPEWTARLEIRVPIGNELHGKISFEDDAGVIPRDAPLMIWNDAVDLPCGTFPAGVHLRPRGTRSILGIWTYDARLGTATFPPTFDSDYADIVLGGLAAMIPGLGIYSGRGREAIVDGGYYCKTPDNRPLIGPTAIEGVYLLGALSGFGIMASQAAAELLATYLLEHERPSYAFAFHPARFDDPAYQHVLALLDSKSGQL
jgi:glycine/D-amino acid oxidase-like deaminating enzyme